MLVEVEAVASRLEQEHDDRRRADELDRALSELENRLAEREAAHRRVSRSIETETATIDAFEDAVRRAASACGLDTSGTAADVCRQLASALDAAERAITARRGLLAAIDEANSDLAEAAGFGPEADLLREELSSGDPVSWEAQGEAAKERGRRGRAGIPDGRVTPNAT